MVTQKKYALRFLIFLGYQEAKKDCFVHTLGFDLISQARLPLSSKGRLGRVPVGDTAMNKFSKLVDLLFVSVSVMSVTCLGKKVRMFL